MEERRIDTVPQAIGGVGHGFFYTGEEEGAAVGLVVV